MRKLYLLFLFVVIISFNGFSQALTYAISMKSDFYGDRTCPVVQILPGNYSFCVTTKKRVGIIDMSNGIHDDDIGNCETNSHVPAELNTTNFKIIYHCSCEYQFLYNNSPRPAQTYSLTIETIKVSGGTKDYKFYIDYA